MQNMFTVITYLLTEHDCVVIPGFGGFVAQKEKALCHKKDGVFTPPSYSIGFNNQLNYNDGLLTDTIKRLKKTDYQTAQKQVEAFSKEIKALLDTQGEVVFPEIGKLTVTSNGNIEFNPFQDTTINASMYGFTTFTLPSIDELQISEPTKVSEEHSEEKNNNVILIPISKRLLKAIATSAAVIIAFLMISTPIDDGSIPGQYASVIETNIRPVQPPVEKIQSEIAQSATVAEEIPSYTTTVEKKKELETTTSSETKLPSIDTHIENIQKDKTSRTYYIIVSSLTSKDKAESVIPKIREQLPYQTSIIEKDNLFRISIAQFSDKKEAEHFLLDFRQQHTKHKDAWLLSAKTSPSYY